MEILSFVYACMSMCMPCKTNIQELDAGHCEILVRESSDASTGSSSSDVPELGIEELIPDTIVVQGESFEYRKDDPFNTLLRQDKKCRAMMRKLNAENMSPDGAYDLTGNVLEVELTLVMDYESELIENRNRLNKYSSIVKKDEDEVELIEELKKILPEQLLTGQRKQKENIMKRLGIDAARANAIFRSRARYI